MHIIIAQSFILIIIFINLSRKYIKFMNIHINLIALVGLTCTVLLVVDLFAEVALTFLPLAVSNPVNCEAVTPYTYLY